jgi:uncharacterized protein
MPVMYIVLLLLVSSQVYWLWTLRGWLKRVLAATRARRTAVAGSVALYLLLLAINFGFFRSGRTPVHLTLPQALFAAPFLWWVASSLVAFIVAVVLGVVKALFRAGRWALRKLRAPAPPDDLPAPARRHFLERTAGAITAAPFVAGAYGLFYGRVNLQTPRQKIAIPNLPREFHGFTIAQLSDIHIGPFMPDGEIRKYVEIANSLRPHMTVLTGDYVTFDRATAPAVVAALSGLRAPFGVYGCLGNHDAWAHAEDMLTRLFARGGVRILRQENTPIVHNGAAVNLIGVDFQTRRRFGPSSPVRDYLDGVNGLMIPGQVNLLLSHNPDSFDRAASLGIDLSIAGHTHGGQAALEFISPEIAPSRLVTPYVAGLFQKPGGQLYVNRGIGTVGIPIRIGAPPEITLFELVRG